MSHFADLRPPDPGGAGHSFLSLDDGPTSPLVPSSSDPLGAAVAPISPRIGQSASRRSSQHSLGQHSLGQHSLGQRSLSSFNNVYDGSELGEHDARSDAGSARRRARRSPKPTSPPRSNQQRILDGTRKPISPPDRIFFSPDETLYDMTGSSATSTTSQAPPRNAATTTNSTSSVSGRFGALVGRAQKGSDGSPMRLPRRSDPATFASIAESDDWPSSTASTSASAAPESETSGPSSLASRFLRSKASRQKVKDLVDPSASRKDGKDLGSAFEPHSERHFEDYRNAAFSDLSDGPAAVLPAGASDNSSALAHQEGDAGDMTQSRPPSRPSSRSNILDMAPSSSASSSRNGHVLPKTRGGRLGRLQYNKTDGFSINSFSRGKEAEAKGLDTHHSRPFNGAGRSAVVGPQASHEAGPADGSAWQTRPESGGGDWDHQQRVALSSSRDPVMVRGLRSALAGLGIEAGLDDARQADASSSSVASPRLVSSSRPDPSYMPEPNSLDEVDAWDRHRSASRNPSSSSHQHDIWLEDHDAGPWSKAVGNFRPAVDTRGVSFTSVQDMYHNRFSRQAMSDGSRYSRSSAHSRDALNRAVDELSPSLEGPTSPTLTQSGQPGSPRFGALPDRSQHYGPDVESHRSSTGPAWSLEGGGTMATVDAQGEASASPPAGTLSDAAIIAMGALPGNGPESLPNANGAPLSSKNVLTIALQKAQSAVQLDSSNNVTEAIAAYRQAVRLLEEVMARIAPKPGKRSRPSREEESRRLRVIHDTYADRIRLLSLICEPDDSDDLVEGDNSYERSFDDTGPAASGTSWNDHRPRSEEKQEPVDEGEQSFLFMTPIGDRHDTSTMDKFISDFSAEPPDPQLASPEPGTGRGRAVMSDVDEHVAIADARERREVLDQSGLGARPHLSMQTAPQQQSRDESNESEEILLDPLAQKHPADAGLSQAHARSDSEGSFQSSRAKGSIGSTSKLRSSVVEEDARRPATPFFDAAADASAGNEDGGGASDSTPTTLGPRKTKLSLTSSGPLLLDEPKHAARPQFLERTAPLFLRKDLTLRTKGSLPSLAKARDAAGAKEATSAAVQPARPSSADSPPNAAPGSGRKGASSIPLPETEGHELFSLPSNVLNRPRASTLAAKGAQPALFVDTLVSSSTLAGTISQRRKQGTPQPSSLTIPPLSDAIARTKSADQAGLALRDVSDASEADVKPPVPGQSSLYSRQRSSSQPGLRRPSIPTAFRSNNGPMDPAPPLPKLFRRLPGGGAAAGDPPSEGDADGASISNVAASGRPLPPQRMSSVPPVAPAFIMPSSSEAMLGPPFEGVAKAQGSTAAALRDVFPSGLPSMASGTPSYATGTSGVTLFPWLGIASQLPDPASTPQVPLQPVLRPFHIMRMLLQSIYQGGYITPRLFVPQGLWVQQGARLVSIESKVRALELIATGLEAVEKGGEPLLKPLGNGVGLETSNGSRFAKHLDELDALMVEVQNSLAKKLGFLETVTGKKAATSFGNLGSKLTRSLDRMTNGKNLDSPVVYVEGLAKVFGRAQVLDKHLVSLLRSQGALETGSGDEGLTEKGSLQDAYAALPTELKGSIESRLRRSSDFFANVILTFVLRDVGVLLDKFVKRGSLVFTD